MKQLATCKKKQKSVNQYEQGLSALHRACVTNSVDAVRILISSGIDLDMKDEVTGASALHYCCSYNYYELATMIIQAGGKVDISDNYGNQPLWTAVFNVKGDLQKLPIVELFLRNGAHKEHKNNAGRSPLDFVNQVKHMPLVELLLKY